MTDQEKLILVAVLAALMLFIVFFELKVMRGKSKEIRKASQKKDEAFNAILTTRHVINVVQRQGGNTGSAQRILDQAKLAMQKGEYDRSMDLAEKARGELTNPGRSESEAAAASGGTGKDLEEVAEKVLSSPKKDITYTGSKLPVDQSSNYMSARFELSAARADLGKASATGKDISSAELLMTDADTAFATGNYTKALSLAVKARKSVGVGGTVETIPLRSKEEAEAEEAEPVEDAPAALGEGCGSCGEPLEKGDAFCGKCGAKVLRERSCDSCGAKAKADDRFCRKCGGKVA